MYIIKTTFVLLLIVFKTIGIMAQGNICFKPMFGNEKLVLSKQYFISNSNNNIQIDVFKFYISNVEFYNNDQLLYKEKNSYHLIDAEDSTSFILPINFLSKTWFNL